MKNSKTTVSDDEHATFYNGSVVSSLLVVRVVQYSRTGPPLTREDNSHCILEGALVFATCRDEVTKRDLSTR
jgi:hypothetical protein